MLRSPPFASARLARCIVTGHSLVRAVDSRALARGSSVCLLHMLRQPLTQLLSAQPLRLRSPLASPSPRCGGGERVSELQTCCDCQRHYRRMVSDANWYLSKGLTPAIRCKQCRGYRLTARLVGDDPDALFPLAKSAVHYRALRNAYVEAHGGVQQGLMAERRENKDARVLLAGGKAEYRRAARKASTKLRRTALRAARKEAAQAAGAGEAEQAEQAPRAKKREGPATALQRLGLED